MKLSVSEWCAVAVIALNLAQIVWVRRRVKRNEAEAKAVRRRVGEPWRRQGAWIQLESGWSIPLGTADAFVILLDDGTAYWWLRRKERTIVEGPAPTLEAARAEIAQAQRTFL